MCYTTALENYSTVPHNLRILRLLRAGGALRSGRSLHRSPAITASCTFIRTSSRNVSNTSSVRFHGSSNLDKVALEATPVGEAAHGSEGSSTTTVITTKRETTSIAASLSFVSPSFRFGVFSGSFSEHCASGNVEKGFNDLLSSAAKAFSGASCCEHVSNLLEDLGHHVPEDKRISNIFPFFFVGVSGNRQVCNVAVLAAPCVPAKGTVSAASAQSCWNSNAVRSANSIKNGIVATVKEVFAARSVARQRTGHAAAASAEERVARGSVKSLSHGVVF